MLPKVHHEKTSPKVYEHTFIFPAISTKGNNFHDFLFVSQDKEAVLKWGLLLQERIFSCRSKFFPLRVAPVEKGGENGIVASPESALSHLKAYTVSPYS